MNTKMICEIVKITLISEKEDYLNYQTIRITVCFLFEKNINVILR